MLVGVSAIAVWKFVGKKARELNKDANRRKTVISTQDKEREMGRGVIIRIFVSFIRSCPDDYVIKHVLATACKDHTADSGSRTLAICSGFFQQASN